MGNNVFQRTGGLLPGRSAFDLSYVKKLTCDMGQLIPVQVDEAVPGDIWEMGVEAVLRFQPLHAPILHQIDVYFHSAFVPYRLIFDQWEDFITRGVDGDTTVALPEFNPVDGVDNVKGTLWDFFGFPTGVDPTGSYPLAFPWRAYNLFYNTFYRDPNFGAEVDLDQNTVLQRCWEKDYFTAALPTQQRGTPPALPISGTTQAVFTALSNLALSWPAVNTGTAGAMQYNVADYAPQAAPTKSALERGVAVATGLHTQLNSHNTIPLTSVFAGDVEDFRLTFQMQRWMERSMRAGPRYIEQLKAHFGVNPRDDRLQRPEYIGGARSPVIISEVLQTSETGTSPQGNLAGHGIAVTKGMIGKYRVLEFGCIITVMSVMPKPTYQQGIPRQWLRKTTFDFPFPEFANLSEQAITNAEICATNSSTHNNGIFGYIGRFDELRTKQDMVVNEMRDTFDYWHLGRQFNIASPPALNETFVQCNPRKDIFAVPSVPGIICNVANHIKAIRPIPVTSEPGLIDHN